MERARVSACVPCIHTYVYTYGIIHTQYIPACVFMYKANNMYCMYCSSHMTCMSAEHLHNYLHNWHVVVIYATYVHLAKYDTYTLKQPS